MNTVIVEEVTNAWRNPTRSVFIDPGLRRDDGKERT
jgi:hypothetical protein